MAKGGPRQFDTGDAIDTAMRVFWKCGYEGASLDVLTRQMGISRPSLYAAFGNKEALFIKALDRYRESPASYVNRALAKPTAREVFESLLNGVIDLVTDPENPGGCLFVSASLGAPAVRNELAARRLDGEDEIRERFDQARTEGDLPAGTDTRALAKLTATLLWGISIQGMNGATRSELRKAAKLAAAAFPGDK